LQEIMASAKRAEFVRGDPAVMAAQFSGLLFGDTMIGLLLRVTTRPDAGEIARRAREATQAFLYLYPEPIKLDPSSSTESRGV
jgi:hypothetical protein